MRSRCFFNPPEGRFVLLLINCEFVNQFGRAIGTSYNPSVKHKECVTNGNSTNSVPKSGQP